jgi:hypothetical protein
VSLMHDHRYGFGEEACEICGMPFLDAGNESTACPGAKSHSTIADNAAARINRPAFDKPRQSFIGLFAHAFRRITY